jgi:hypothetical protein
MWIMEILFRIWLYDENAAAASKEYQRGIQIRGTLDTIICHETQSSEGNRCSMPPPPDALSE